MADAPNERHQNAKDLYRQQAELAKEREELNSLFEILKIMNDPANAAGESK